MDQGHRVARCMCIGLVFLLSLSCSSVRIPDTGSRVSVVFYAKPADLTPGARLDPDDLESRLVRLGYRESSRPAAHGEYRREGHRFVIGLRPFHDPEGDFGGGLAELVIVDGRVASATIDVIGAMPGGPARFDIRLEPERLASYAGETATIAEPLALEDTPQLLRDAVVAVEDRRFYRHPGIDLAGTARAVFVNLRHRETVQGGSTLTQQLARSLFLSNARSIDRKVREARLALALEARYTKDEILEAYLNAIYWGHWGGMEIRGARAASRYYLQKEITEATTGEVALLAGLIRAPNAYSPYVSPERAARRRDFVLGLLEKNGMLTPDEARRAKAERIRERAAPTRVADPGYFLDAARAEIARRAPAGTLERGEISVYTSLDTRDQEAATLSISEGISRLERDNRRLRRKKEPLQAAAVVIDPANGEVTALVGGRDYHDSPFNRATEAHRQPGSLFKPFVYLTAFLHPFRSDGTCWTPVTRIIDEPLEIPAGRKTYRPQNYDREYRGEVTVRMALEQSINVPTARVGQEVGLSAVARTAKDLGIASQLHEVPSLALGSSEVTLLEIAVAYGTIANTGRAHAATLLRGILNERGEHVALAVPETPPGVAAEPAYVLTRILEGVIDEGTGARSRALGVDGIVAGKTGTTDDYRDAWFAGFSARRAAAVWVGFDRTDVTGLSGASAALPIWAGIFRRIQPPGGDGNFTRPTGVLDLLVDPESGKLATPGCPEARDEVFLAGTEPSEECTLHRGFRGWLRGLFGD